MKSLTMENFVGIIKKKQGPKLTLFQEFLFSKVDLFSYCAVDMREFGHSGPLKVWCKVNNTSGT